MRKRRGSFPSVDDALTAHMESATRAYERTCVKRTAVVRGVRVIIK